MATEILKIVFSEDDVRSMAELAEVDFDVAMDRATEWGRHIADTATQLINEQLESVIKHNQP